MERNPADGKAFFHTRGFLMSRLCLEIVNFRLTRGGGEGEGAISRAGRGPLETRGREVRRHRVVSVCMLRQQLLQLNHEVVQILE